MVIDEAKIILDQLVKLVVGLFKWLIYWWLTSNMC
jgi:hypothetical protein